MVNNYYIGDIHHNKTIKKDAYTEKLVLYSDDKYKDMAMTKASKRMFDLAGVKYRKFEGRMPSITFKR